MNDAEILEEQEVKASGRGKKTCCPFCGAALHQNQDVLFTRTFVYVCGTTMPIVNAGLNSAIRSNRCKGRPRSRCEFVRSLYHKSRGGASEHTHGVPYAVGSQIKLGRSEQ